MKIGVAGPISEVNYGDYAMLINNMYDLGLEHEYTLFYYENGEDTAFSEIENFYLKDFQIKKVKVEIKLKDELSNEFFIKKILSKFVKKTQKILEIKRKKRIISPPEILASTQNIGSIIKNIKDIDVLVVNGGGYFNDLWYNWDRDVDLFSIISPILVANQLKKKIVFTGNGFGPFDSSSEFFSAFFASIKDATFGVRDGLLSLPYLKSLGMESNSTFEIPDDLLILNDKLKMKKNDLHIPFDNYILIELYFGIRELTKLESILMQFSETMKEKYDISLIFVPFQKGIGGEAQGKYLKELLQKDLFFLYDINKHNFVPISDLNKLVENSRMVISTRYHGLVTALSNGIPACNILKKVSGDYRYYYNKNVGVLNMVFENQEYDYTEFVYTNLTELLEDLMENWNSIEKKQKDLFFNIKYKEQLLKLKGLRSEHLKKINT